MDKRTIKIGGPRSPKHLAALWRFAVRRNGRLNPYGMRGNTDQTVYYVGNRDNQAFYGAKVMKRNRHRKRIALVEQKRRALEMHELQQLARENAVDAMKTLIDISTNPRAPEQSRIAASTVILDRGYGKSSQTTISANVTHGKANELTGDDLDKRIGHALKRVESLTNRAPKEGTGQKGPDLLRKLN